MSAPVEPLARQVDAASVATRREEFERRLANIEANVIRANIAYWKVGHRMADRGVLLPTVAERAGRMYEALVEGVAQMDRRAS